MLAPTDVFLAALDAVVVVLIIVCIGFLLTRKSK